MLLTVLRILENVHGDSDEKDATDQEATIKPEKGHLLEQKSYLGRIYIERHSLISHLQANQSAISTWESTGMTAIIAILPPETRCGYSGKLLTISAG